MSFGDIRRHMLSKPMVWIVGICGGAHSVMLGALVGGTTGRALSGALAGITVASMTAYAKRAEVVAQSAQQ